MFPAKTENFTEMSVSSYHFSQDKTNQAKATATQAFKNTAGDRTHIGRAAIFFLDDADE